MICVAGGIYIRDKAQSKVAGLEVSKIRSCDLETTIIHTRTNSVDTHVHGLFCCNVRTYHRPQKGVYLPKCILSRKFLGKRITCPFIPANTRHTSSENVRTDNINIRETWRYMYRHVLLTVVISDWGENCNWEVNEMNWGEEQGH